MSLLQQGERLGDYRVLSHLGSGGMGEVYVAEDSRLGRKVALKILPVATAGDAHRRHRFVNEARAASSLQHPNIVTVFELGRDGERDFIAMELVEGESLRDLLSRGRIAPRRAFEIGAQIAAALEAGHAAGVVHRDIKPENILIAPNGTAKLLDYGLAKREEARGQIEIDAPTVPALHTEPGAILGTVSYMSPEQAEGLMTDSRTDIFSLGVVLYEMLTGRKPFQGKSTVDQLHKIINADPPNVLEVNPDLPPGAADVLEKALAKQRENRYQHAGDLRIDLRRLTSATAVTQHARTTNRWLVVALALSLLVAVAAAYAVWRGKPSATPAAEMLTQARMAPFTIDPGYEDEPTFSPDGASIAYVSDRSGNLEIYLRQTGGGPDINLTNNPADDAQPSWSPDGKQIAFVSTRESGAALVYRNPGSPLMGGDIWVMPAFGGAPRRVVGAANFPSWSPDGTRIIYSAGPWMNQKIYTVAVTGGAPREVPIRFVRRDIFIFRPTYSPDGKWILFEAQNRRISVVAAQGGQARDIVRGLTPSWASDGKAILYSAAEPGRNLSLAALPFDGARGEPDGPSRLLTFGRGRDVSAVMSRDGKRIAFAGQTVTFNIEKIRLDDVRGTSVGDPVPVTQGLQLSPFFDVSPDGRSITYQSTQGNDTQIWRRDEGALPVQLTYGSLDSQVTQPVFSPDGKQIAFCRSTGDADEAEICVMNADGTDPRVLFQGNSAFLDWTPDGRGITYFSRKLGQVALFVISSRTTQRLTAGKDVIAAHAISDDGQWLAFGNYGVGGTSDISAVRFGQPGPSMPVVATRREDFHPDFDATGKWLYFQFDHRNIHRVPGPAQNWRKAEPQQVTHFPESNLFIDDPQVTRDSKWLVYSRARIDSDLWVMELPSSPGK